MSNYLTQQMAHQLISDRLRSADRRRRVRKARGETLSLETEPVTVRDPKGRPHLRFA